MLYRYRIVFSKKGMLRFISHLDLVRLFQRVVRRAALPVVISSGFTPRPKISFKRALKLGLESEAEEIVLQMSRPLGPAEIKTLMEKQLPPEIRIMHVELQKG